jgi:hypothetical protein
LDWLIKVLNILYICACGIHPAALLSQGCRELIPVTAGPCYRILPVIGAGLNCGA